MPVFHLDDLVYVEKSHGYILTLLPNPCQMFYNYLNLSLEQRLEQNSLIREGFLGCA